MEPDKLLVRYRLSRSTQACKSSSPDKNMVENSSLSAVCQSNLDPLQSGRAFSLLFSPPVCLPLLLFPTPGNFYLCGVKLCVSRLPTTRLSACLSLLPTEMHFIFFYSQHRRVNPSFLCDCVICILLPDKLYVKRPKQTGFILFPGTEHVRGSMTYLIPLHAALKSWYSSSCSTCCWAHCSIRGRFHVSGETNCLFFFLLVCLAVLFWDSKKRKNKDVEQWGVFSSNILEALYKEGKCCHPSFRLLIRGGKE